MTSKITSDMLPALSVQAIKNILLKEHESYIYAEDYRKVCGMLDYYKFAMELVVEQIKACQSYDDLDNFIHLSRRMNLKTWIETL